ncbi:hypothetical protein F4677DRAFT_464584 [Hypoxylon crocopeplum]|nr:hypothetical protein F4677DRAFT_464584 [Hypoxylon crocopeplum]
MDPNTTPALKPPPGVESNFKNPYSLQPQRIAISTVCLTVCMIAVTARIYTRTLLLNKFNTEDWVLLLSTASFTTFTALLIVAGEHGDGTHQWDVSVADLTKNLLLENVSEIIYCITMFTIKYVVLRQIESIFFNHHRKVLASKVISFLIWANFLLYTGAAFAFIFACVPREKIWNKEIDGSCINAPASIAAGSSLNVISDITILITPIDAIWKLQLPLKKKIRTAAVFAVGIFAIVASIMRLYYGLQLFYAVDVTWAISPVGQWTIAEFITGFLVACSPYFPRLFDHILGRDKQVSHNASYGGASYQSKSQSSRIRADRSWAALTAHETGDNSSKTIILSDLPRGTQEGVTNDSGVV